MLIYKPSDVVTTIVDNSNGTFTYTNEAAAATVIDVCAMLNSCSIDVLSDVDTTTVTPNASDVLQWDGTNWVPAAPAQFGEFQSEFDVAAATDFSVPAAQVTNNGDWFPIINGPTVIDGQTLDPGDILVALVDNPSTTTFAGNWALVEHPGAFVSVVSNLIAGNRIATHDDANGTVVDIDESITTMVQAVGTGIITYTQEGGTTQTANVISTDADNDITVGSDGGAYLCTGGPALPNAHGCIECNGTTLTVQDQSYASVQNMTFAANAVSIQVSDGTTTNPVVLGNVGTTITANTGGLNTGAATWTVTQVVNATVCGQAVSQTCVVDIPPCG